MDDWEGADEQEESEDEDDFEGEDEELRRGVYGVATASDRLLMFRLCLL